MCTCTGAITNPKVYKVLYVVLQSPGEVHVGDTRMYTIACRDILPFPSSPVAVNAGYGNLWLAKTHAVTLASQGPSQPANTGL